MAGLTAALVLPGAASVHAADPVVLRVGTTQDLDSLNPYNTLLVVGYEVFGLTYNYLVDSGPNLEPVAGFADKWERAADGQSWTFHIRDDMKWSDGAARHLGRRLLLVAARPRRDQGNKGESGSLGAGYLDPTLQGRRRHDGRLPGPDHDGRHDRRPVRPRAPGRDADHPQARLGQGDLQDHRRRPSSTARSSAPARTRSATGRPASSSSSSRNPNYWGTQAYQDEVDIVIYKGAPDTMVQALKAGELDYAHGPNADQLNQLKTDPNIATVAGKANGWTPARLQRVRRRHRQDHPEGRPVHQGAARPGVPRRPRLRDRPQDLLVAAGARRLRRSSAPRSCRRSSAQWHVEPTTPRTFDIEKAKQLLDAAGYTLDASGQAARQGRQADHPADLHARLR